MFRVNKRLFLRDFCKGIRPLVWRSVRPFVCSSVHPHRLTMTDNPYDDPETVRFLDSAHQLMIDTLRSGVNGPKVTEFVQPEQLKELLDLEIGEEPESCDQLLERCKTVAKYSVKTVHPMFMNQLYSGVEPHSLVGAWLTDALNTNIHTFEVSPAFVVMENYIFQKLSELVGFENGDGIFCPGGLLTNTMALHVARFKLCPQTKTTGLYNQPPFKLYTSAEAHYSLLTASSFLGFGSDNVVKIDTDERGKMKPEHLRQQIEKDVAEGCKPLFVMATCGTTVLGAYDPLVELADICSKHNVWLHADACWGGGVLLSEKLRHKVKGIERADSVAWNLHKMCGAILQCSALVLREKGLLEKTNNLFAEYLYQRDKNYDVSYDIGDKSVQCGRKVDVLKLWLLWKAKGDRGMTERVEKAFDNAQYLTEKLRNTDGFRLCMPSFECCNVCVWYIPPSLRNQEETPEWWQKVSEVAPKIKERMMAKGNMMIGFTPLAAKGFVNFFRIIIDNSLQDHTTMDTVVEEIDLLGRDL